MVQTFWVDFGFSNCPLNKETTSVVLVPGLDFAITRLMMIVGPQQLEGAEIQRTWDHIYTLVHVYIYIYIKLLLIKFNKCPSHWKSSANHSTHQHIFGWEAMMWCDCRCDPRCYEVPGQADFEAMLPCSSGITTSLCFCSRASTLKVSCFSVAVGKGWRHAKRLLSWVVSVKQTCWIFGEILGGT